jgi:hypothetical protein
MNIETFEKNFLEDTNKEEVLKQIICKKIEQFEKYIKTKENLLSNPRSEINHCTTESINRINNYLSDYILYLNKFKDHVVSFIESYRENAFSKLESIKHEDIETIKKLIFRCKEAFKDWNEIVHDANYKYNYHELTKIILEKCELETKLYETYENIIFNTQRLHSSENKFYRLVDEYTNYYENESTDSTEYKFYLDLNRLSHVKTGKTLKVASDNTFDCKLFATFGGRFIAVWCEKSVCKLQLIDINENGETVLPICTVTNVGVESVLIAGSDKGNIVAIAFTFDNKTYWLKAYNSNLKELGVIKIDYKPIQFYVVEKHIFTIEDANKFIHVYDSNLKELTDIEKDIESIVYYFNKFGENICFSNGFVFVLNDKSSLSIIKKDINDVVQQLKVDKVKLFKIDTLLRLILYSEDPLRMSIHGINGDTLHEFVLDHALKSFCVTDDGYLLASSGKNGEVRLF